MKQSYNDLVKRIQQFSMTCDIKDENDVVHHFHHGHEYVEIGGLKWATMNVGAEKPTDNGLYFAWGESNGYSVDQVKKGVKHFIWSDYEHGGVKYNNYDRKATLDVEDDGVAVNWGGKWRMPTTTELQTLGNAVTTAWTSDYKSTRVNGMVCTAKDGSGAELFFPAAGFCYDGSMYDVGSYGCYWSSSLYSYNVQQVYGLSFFDVSMDWQNYITRRSGRSLRGVVGE